MKEMKALARGEAMHRMIAAVVGSLTLVPTMAWPAEFFEESGAGLTEAQVSTLRSTDAVFTTAEGQEEVVLDDMRFRVSDLFATGFTGKRWSGGRFVYAFDSNVSPGNREKFDEACDVWAQVSAVTCVERTTEANFAYVRSSPLNRSYVGMVGGKQDLEIFNWDWKYIIAHEIGHALGLSHEQSRADRDSYVEILEANVEAGKIQNFHKRNTTSYSPYDFRSIMHYGPTAFSKNGGPTIQARPSYKAEEPHMGNRDYLSAADAAGMASRYGPSPTP